MLSLWFMNWIKKNPNRNILTITSNLVVLFVLLIILDAIIISYAAYVLSVCTDFKWYINAIFLILLLIPGIGYFTGLSLILYYNFKCKATGNLN